MMISECAQPLIYLKMGEIAFVDQPSTITTILGSCVAVTLFDRRRGYGAMCHGVMPSCKSSARCSGRCPRHGHYVECSVLAMVRRFGSSGVPKADIEARVFGGAELFALPSRLRGLFSVGTRNVVAATSTLTRNGIAVSSQTVGGSTGCRIYFNTMSGAVSVQRVDPAIYPVGEH